MLSPRLLNTFGRRIGKRLGQESKDVITRVLPEYAVNIAQLQNQKKLYLEIGFGNGDFIIEYAKTHPDILCIGSDPFLNGVANLLKKIVAYNIENIRIWPDDVRLLLAQLPDDVFDIVYILFPDPWPKRKQHQRRLINSDFLTMLGNKMKPGGELNIATDHQDYASWIAQHLKSQQIIVEQSSEQGSEQVFADVNVTRYFKRAASLAAKLHFFWCKKQCHR